MWSRYFEPTDCPNTSPASWPTWRKPCPTILGNQSHLMFRWVADHCLTNHVNDFGCQVSFAGLTSRTSVKRSTSCPVWNEQIVITEMFPPLCQRIKIQIRDSDPVSDTVIATHFIPLSKISNEGPKGFLPTFGPSFVFLYGSLRDGNLFDDQSVLNDGFSEGVMFRGRLLLAIHTEILESVEANISNIIVEPTPPINEVSAQSFHLQLSIW